MPIQKAPLAVDDAAVLWLAKKYFDECSLQFRTIWQLYLTFYVAFLTVNGAALGLTVQYVTSSNGKVVIALAFILQNSLAAGTAARIAKYSSDVSRRMRDLTEFVFTNGAASEMGVLPAVLQESPIPAGLGYWGGIANLISHVIFVVLWVIVFIVPFNKV